MRLPDHTSMQDTKHQVVLIIIIIMIIAARVKQITKKILGDKNHPLHKELTFLPSGRRLRQKGYAPRYMGHHSSHAQSASTATVIRFIMYALPCICTNHVYTIVSPFYVCMLYHWQSKSLTAIQVILSQRPYTPLPLQRISNNSAAYTNRAEH